MQTHLRMLIERAKPRRALFTTFTFSINWFETFILPELRNHGCQQIDVLVDAREARRSTDDTSASRVGTDYRVIPVPMTGKAVFHPKIAYLQGGETDSLVVSSANLTLSGHGKNLEVLDAVSADGEPGVFVEFSEFLETLLTQHTFQADNAEVLRGYQRHAARWREASARVDGNERRAWLVHTLKTPAFDQFVTFAEQIAGAHTLTVLSPYHAPDGAPLRELAELIGVSKIRVGLSAGGPHPYVARFRESQDDLTYVVPDTDNARRFAHAKVFELTGRRGATLVMAGSVNATRQSLMSTMNAEISLVRRLSKSPFVWEECEPVEFKENEFNTESLTGGCASLEATWTVANRIVGRIAPAQASQLVRLEIWAGPTMVQLLEDVPLQADGTFSARAAGVPSAHQAFRLMLTGETVQASGWLNLQAALSADEQERKALRLTQRLAGGDVGDNDFEEMLAWLDSVGPATGPARTRPPTGSGSAGPKPAAPEPAPDITPDEWRGSAKPYRDEQGRPEITALQVGALERYLGGDDLYQQADEPTGEPVGPGMRIFMSDREENEVATTDPHKNTKRPPKDRKAEKERHRQQFLGRLPARLALGARDFFVPVLVETSGNIVRFGAMRRHTAQDTDGESIEKQHAVSAWLDRYAGFDYGAEFRERLLPYFCANACFAAQLLADEQYGVMKEALFRLAGRDLTAGEVHQHAHLGMAAQHFSRVPDVGREEIAARAADIVGSQTRDQQLLALVVGVMLSPGEQPLIPLAYETIFKELRIRQRSREAFGLVARASEKPGCPSCYWGLDREMLRRERAMVCMTCKLPIFYGLDREELLRQGLANRFKGG